MDTETLSNPAEQLPMDQFFELLNRVDQIGGSIEQEVAGLLSQFQDSPSSPTNVPAQIQDENSRAESIRRHLSTRTYAAGGAEEGGGGFSDGFCVICHLDFSDGERIGNLECRHEYHASCIQTWLLRNNHCPVCRQTAIKELE